VDLGNFGYLLVFGVFELVILSKTKINERNTILYLNKQDTVVAN